MSDRKCTKIFLKAVIQAPHLRKYWRFLCVKDAFPEKSDEPIIIAYKNSLFSKLFHFILKTLLKVISSWKSNEILQKVPYPVKCASDGVEIRQRKYLPLTREPKRLRSERKVKVDGQHPLGVTKAINQMFVLRCLFYTKSIKCKIFHIFFRV